MAQIVTQGVVVGAGCAGVDCHIALCIAILNRNMANTMSQSLSAQTSSAVPVVILSYTILNNIMTHIVLEDFIAQTLYARA